MESNKSLHDVSIAFFVHMSRAVSAVRLFWLLVSGGLSAATVREREKERERERLSNRENFGTLAEYTC